MRIKHLDYIERSYLERDTNKEVIKLESQGNVIIYKPTSQVRKENIDKALS